MYSDNISIKTLTSRDSYSGNVYATAVTIKGAIQDKIKTVLDVDGKQITTNNVLNSLTDIDTTTLIVYGGREREIKQKSSINNHLFGTFDHYEYLF